MDTTRLQALLYESEGATLDFKREQYRFIRANDEDKAELLKDLLAFANSWRREEAYILVGVQDSGGSAVILGADEHPDDAQLQQFVNSKTSRPLLFSYEVVDHDGRKVGVFRIPLQPRPVYLKRDFGPLKRDVVYIRRGSSTAIADPTEIARMGASDALTERPKPRLSLSLVRPGTTERLGTAGSARSEVVVKPAPEMLPRVRRSAYGIDFKNSEYYIELADFIHEQKLVSPFLLAVSNDSAVSADDVVVELSVDRLPGIVILDRTRLIERPRYEGITTIHESLAKQNAPRPDVAVEVFDRAFRVAAKLGHIRPGSTGITRDALFVGATTSVEIAIAATILARDVLPTELMLRVNVETTHREMNADDFAPYVSEDVRD